MKKILILSFIMISILACTGGKNKDDININVVENQAAIKFDKDIIDFKQLNAGELF